MLCRHRACTLSKRDGSPGSKPARFFFNSYQAKQRDRKSTELDGFHRRRPVAAKVTWGLGGSPGHLEGAAVGGPDCGCLPVLTSGLEPLQGMGQSGVTYRQATDGGGGVLFVFNGSLIFLLCCSFLFVLDAVFLHAPPSRLYLGLTF